MASLQGKIFYIARIIKACYALERRRRMSEKSEIVFMQVRLLRLASEEWHTTIQKASRLFEKYGILKFIEDCYGVFHTKEYGFLSDSFGIICRAKVNRIISRNNPRKC